MRKLEGGPHQDVRGSQPLEKAMFGPPGGEGGNLGVGPTGRLLDVRGYVWPIFRPAVVYGRHVRGFPTPLLGTAGTLAVCGGAGSDGRYIGCLRWSRIQRPVRWPFAVEPDLAAVTLAVCGAAGSGGRYVGRFRLSRIRRPVHWPFCGGGKSGSRYVDGSHQS